MTADCKDIVARLSEPDGKSDSEVQAHLTTCGGCREALVALKALAATAQTPSPEVLGHFATRVRAAHLRAQESRQRSAPMRTGLLAGLSAVAGAAAVAFLLQFAFPTHHAPTTEPGPPEIVVAAEPSQVNPATAAVDDEWAAASDELSTEMVAGADDQEFAYAADDDDAEAI
jgi:uncharacterized protein YfaQ (DUF2300 family)